MEFTQLCREYGISTKTGYKWRERYLQYGYAGLTEESRRPKSNGKALEEWISVELLRIKKSMRHGAPRKFLTRKFLIYIYAIIPGSMRLRGVR